MSRFWSPDVCTTPNGKAHFSQISRLQTFILLILLLFSAGCEKQQQNEINFESALAGAMQSPEKINLFSSAVSSLLEGNKNQYNENLKSLNLSQQSSISNLVIQGKRDSSKPYRGLFLNDIRDIRWALANVGKIKAAGIDTILFNVHYVVSPDNLFQLYVPAEKVYLFYINAFHESGFRTWIAMSHTSYDFPYAHYSETERLKIPPLENQAKILDMIHPLILEWAEISEKYNVDAFIPAEEANTLLLKQGVDITDLCSPEREIMNSWMQQILPEIRQRFSGKIGFATNDGGPCESSRTSGASGPDFNYQGYDFIVYKIPFRSVFADDAQWDDFAFYLIPSAVKYAERDNAELVLYETGDTVGKAVREDFAGSLPIRDSNEQHQKESYEKDFELLDKYEKITGLFFKISEKQYHEPSWNPFGNSAEQVLKNNFGKHGALELTELDKLWISIGDKGLKAVQFCLSEQIPFDPDSALDNENYYALMEKVKSACD